MHLCETFNTDWHRDRGVKCRMRWTPYQTAAALTEWGDAMKHIVTDGGKSAAAPPYNMEITTDDPEKIGQAFGNADFRIKSGEMGAHDGEAISTSGTRIHLVRARHVKTPSSNMTVQKNPGGTTS